MSNTSHFMDMSGETVDTRRRYEKSLARLLRPFIAELQLADAGVLIGYILFERDELLADLIDSSTEGHLKTGFLRYGGTASAFCEWGRKPMATIELELRHTQMTAYFSLVFDSDFVGVNLHGLLFSRWPGDDEETWRRFAAVLADGSVSETGPGRIDRAASDQASDRSQN
ncbi:hypothetical protein [Amorphus orientalis]|uniref:Uncharacterized protein n=1 Tax=Amorphus orientalis TaxID=649198 RepID=A0AAE3VRT1_9HYPH|nr:hypothetical protein [Amorphus orientalis]MDQ0317589.1 hypothetical protein [Amorphus orientalis]